MSNSTSGPDIVSLGESLVDFLPDCQGVPLREVDSFRKVVGGAPTNLAIGAARLGVESALVGMVGEDEFGSFIIESLRDAGVAIGGIRRTDQAPTGLTFVTLEADGERSFLFYRHPSADALLTAADVDCDSIRDATVFQFGSNLLTESNLREATARALEAADSGNTLVSFDPNIRPDLWSSDRAAREAVFDVLDGVDVLKVNREELAFLAADQTVDQAWREIFGPEGVRLLVVTDGADGARALCSEMRAETSAPDVEVVDTTGAGDGFLSGFLTGIVESLTAEEARQPAAAVSEWTESTWRPILALGCHVGSMVCEQLGATPGLPTRDPLPDELFDSLR